MSISLKNLIGKDVYKNNEGEPWGKVKGIHFSQDESKVVSVEIESLSLIPISTLVPINEIIDTEDKKLILKSGICLNKGQKCRMPKTICTNGKLDKIKDVRFDFETGEITDIVIGKGVLRRNEKIKIDKITIKNNTIYTE